MALFGKKPPAPTALEQLPQELAVLIQKAQEERTKISSLLGRTKGSVEKLEKLDAPLSAVADRTEEIARRLKQMEDRFAQLDAVAGRLDQVSQRAAVAEQTHAAMENRVGKINADVADVAVFGSRSFTLFAAVIIGDPVACHACGIMTLNPLSLLYLAIISACISV